MATAHAIQQQSALSRARPPVGLRRPAAPQFENDAGLVPILPGITTELHRIGCPVAAERGQEICIAGAPADHVYKVVDGTLRISRLLPDGRRHIANFLTQGDFFGFSDIGDYTYSLEALTDCALIRYPRRRFDAILEHDPQAGRQMFRLLCRQFNAANELLMTLSRKTAAERIATFLLTMIHRQGSQDGRQLMLAMPRVDIADHLGLTIETVSRVVTQLRQRRLIDLRGSNDVAILNRDALEELAGD
ncbi:cyclic nucleotide-binding domain-containing protein [Ferrovibrio sp.]|uniref:Crp/Fnr family transcriptional regulator n=1 Tax=Ferrovibrio sp. TaxID=1917215 RepID=UPI00263116AE|nr:cyclic nucleotide-binding domain-containing protein [Ferrovibrio sp.]